MVRVFLLSTKFLYIQQILTKLDNNLCYYTSLGGDNMILNHKEAISFLRIWMKDIQSVSIQRYDDIVELLINNHYLLLIENKGLL